MTNLSLVTIFIPMREYSLFRDFQLEFWKDYPCKIVVIDDKTITISSLGQLIHQEHTASLMDLQDRMERVIDFLDTHYFLWLGEDDLVNVPSLEKAIEILQNRSRNEKSDRFAIYSSPREYNFRFLYRKYGHQEYRKRYSTIQDSAITRALSMLNEPMDRHFYALQETVVVKSVFHALTSGVRLVNPLWYRMFPSFFELGCTILQKTLADENIWYLKGNRRFSNQIGKSKLNDDEIELTELQDLVKRNLGELEAWCKSFANRLSYSQKLTESEIQSLCQLLVTNLCERDASARIQQKVVVPKIRHAALKTREIGPSYFPRYIRKSIYLSAKKLFQIYEYLIPIKIPWKLVFGKKHNRVKKVILRYR